MLLILEDIRARPQGCIFKTVMETPFDLEGEKHILKQYAKLHAMYWRNAPSGVWKCSRETGQPIGNSPSFIRFFSEQCAKGMIKRFEDKLNFYEDVKTVIKLTIENFPVLNLFSAKGPTTMVHGDSHMGNIFLNKDRDAVGFVDFQAVADMNSVRDITYHLIFSCPSDLLEEREEEFLRYYLQELKIALEQSAHPEYAAEVPTYEEAYFMHRVFALWIMNMAVHAMGLVPMVVDDFALSFCKRCVEACHRLRTLEAFQEVLAGKK